MLFRSQSCITINPWPPFKELLISNLSFFILPPFVRLLTQWRCWCSGYWPRYHALTGWGPVSGPYFEVSGAACGSQSSKSESMSKTCRPINCSKRSTSVFNSSIPRPPSKSSSSSPPSKAKSVSLPPCPSLTGPDSGFSGSSGSAFLGEF